MATCGGAVPRNAGRRAFTRCGHLADLAFRQLAIFWKVQKNGRGGHGSNGPPHYLSFLLLIVRSFLHALLVFVWLFKSGWFYDVLCWNGFRTGDDAWQPGFWLTPPPGQLQCSDQFLWEGRQMAAGSELLPRNVQGPSATGCGQLQCHHEFMPEGRAFAACFEFVWGGNLSAVGQGQTWLQTQGSAAFFSIPLKAMPGNRLVPNVISFNAAISSCQRGGHWNEAMNLLETMLSKPSLSPDLVSFNSTMASFQKDGQWEQSLGLLDLMCREKVAPDVISFSSAITSCEKGGNWQYALALFEAMRKRDLVTLSGTF